MICMHLAPSLLVLWLQDGSWSHPVHNKSPTRPHRHLSISLIPMEAKKKQERAIVHLEKEGQHYYYGNLKALCDHWGKDASGSRTLT